MAGQPWRTRLRFVSALAGALLVLFGVYAGYWWYYRLAPLRHVYDPSWIRAHSEADQWNEAQEAIRRSGWFHDAFGYVGRYGDRGWAEWIVSRARPGMDLDSCSAGHQTNALRDLTNQDAGRSAEDWIAWWARNKSKSQAEWIAEGFRARGIEIDIPPTADQWPRLLALLQDSDEQKSPDAPDYIQYNVYRCLRASQFDPIEFSLAHRELASDVERGLRTYERWQR